MLGTYLPAWAIGPTLGVTVPTVFVKLRDPFEGPVAVSVRAGLVYFAGATLPADVTGSRTTEAGIFVLPLEAALSARFNRWFTQSLLFTYVYVAASGADTGETSIRGAAGVDSFSASTFLEVRLSRVAALTLLVRVLAYQGNAHVAARFSQGATTVDADIGARPRTQELVACAVPGVSFSWEHLNLNFGLGYGNWWLPVVELPLRTRQIVPDVNFYVRF